MVRTPRLMLLSALGCVGAFGALLALAYYVPAARWLDQASLYGFIQLDRGPLDTLANGLAHVCDPLPVAILGTAGIVAAAATRGLRYGAAAAVLLVGANVSSQVLKPLLAHPRPITVFDSVHIQNAAYPSGHATASMTLALAAVMLTPRAQRPLVAVIGGAFSLTISFSVVVLHWHFPSDVVGGYLVATAWTLVTLAALRYSQARWPQPGSMRLAARDAVPSFKTIGLGGLAIATLAVVAAATRASDVAHFAHRYTSAVVVAGAIALSAALLLAGVTALSRRRR